MTRVLLLLFSALIVVRCSDRDFYPAPVFVSPANGTTFYPNEPLTLVWEVPDSTRTVEIQSLPSYNSKILTAGTIPFDTIKSHLGSMFITNRSRYVEFIGETLSMTMYVGYRLRYHGAHGTSDWSAPRYYTFAPFTTLPSKEIVVPFTFDFYAQSVGPYLYDDEVLSHEILDLDQLLIDNGLEAQALEFVKADSGYVKDIGDYPSHIEHIVFGFGGGGDATYPFNVLGGTGNLQSEPRLEFVPNGGNFRDLRKELTDSRQAMRLVYFLDHLQKQEGMIGKSHHLEVYLRLKCYYK